MVDRNIAALLAGAALWAGLAASGAASAQVAPVLPGSSSGKGEVLQNEPAPELPAPAATLPPPGAGEIVVRGLRERMSSWREAETDHVVLYSNGSEKDLKRVAANLEKLDALLTLLFDVKPKEVEPARLSITLVGREDFVDRMRLHTGLVGDSGFFDPFATERYYQPGSDRVLLVAGRTDQVIDLDPANMPDFSGMDDSLSDMSDLGSSDYDSGFFDDPDMGMSGGGGRSGMQNLGRSSFSTGGMRRLTPPSVRRPWESILYATYAEHFMLTHFPTSYPRWYLDGLGALFSTFAVAKDGRLEYGRTPPALLRVLDDYPPFRAAPILSGEHLKSPMKSVWSPYHAWLLAHYFVMGSPPVERRAELLFYLMAAGKGEPLDEAVKSFKDLEALERDVDAYRKGETFFRRLALPGASPLEPVVERLTATEAKVLEATAILDSRLAPLPLLPADATQKDRDRLAKREAARAARLVDYLEDLRKLAKENPANRKAQLLLAEATCRGGQAAECRGVADSILAAAPGDADALGWKGIAELQLAAKGDPSAARKTVIAANRADTEATRPLIAYFRSFSDHGLPVPDVAKLGLLKVIAQNPVAAEPRLLLGAEFARTGNVQAAREILLPVLNADETSAEWAKARQLLAGLPRDAKLSGMQ